MRRKSGFIVATSTELPRGSDERSTKPWDVFYVRFIKISILVDNLNLIIHMSSQTVDLSHAFEMANLSLVFLKV